MLIAATTNPAGFGQVTIRKKICNFRNQSSAVILLIISEDFVVTSVSQIYWAACVPFVIFNALICHFQWKLFCFLDDVILISETTIN